MTGRYIRSTFVMDQREFVQHLQIGKQIGKLLDMPKGPQAEKHMFWVFGHLKIKKVEFVDYVRNEAILVLVFYYLLKQLLVFVFFRRELIWLLGEK